MKERFGLPWLSLRAPGMKNKSFQTDKPALELIEEAINLIRCSPGNILSTYYIGSLPFMLGLLYFWADMSRGGSAPEHVVEASLGMAFLFLWMKCWQAV